MEILGVIDELFALEFSNVEASLGLMEGLILVELVSISSSHNVCVHVLLSHEELTITDHRVLRET